MAELMRWEADYMALYHSLATKPPELQRDEAHLEARIAVLLFDNNIVDLIIM